MDESDWGFMPLNSRSNTVACVLCGAHGWGIATHDREGEQIGWGLPLSALSHFSCRWQEGCWAPHPFFCACGKAFPKLQSLGAHVAGNRRWRNPGHGSMERVGYGQP